MARILTEEAAKQGFGIVVTSIGKHLPLEYDAVMQLSGFLLFLFGGKKKK